MRAFNRFILNDEYAHINLSTMGKNLSTLPVWDTNKFSTNLIMHPYHGSMYFNSARNNGYNFYQSIPFTFGGSLMWEYLMETKPPSINDLVATTVSGTALGEVTYRLSDMILDNRATGVERIGRELIAGIFAPTRFINRLTTKEAWTVQSYKGNSIDSAPFWIDIYAGEKSIWETEKDKDIRRFSIGTQMQYGEINESIEKPYDWFRIGGEVNIGGGSVYLTQVNQIGVILNKEWYNSDDTKIMGGIFQHFNYYNLKMQTKDKTPVTPYYISEAAAFGPGLLAYKKNDKIEARTQVFVSGIALGASISDYFNIDDRDYNMGSGLSIKLQTELQIKKNYFISLFSENYIIYTWKGLDEKVELKDLTMPEIDFLNVQGDRSTAKLHVFGASINYKLNEKFHFLIKNRTFSRNTSYKYFPSVNYMSHELFFGVGLKI